MDSDNKVIRLSACRTCSTGKYLTHTLPSGETVTILIGIPSEGASYKAISHVWGDVTSIKVQCQGCDAKSQVRLRGVDTFLAMMNIAGASSTIWVDNLSIDQGDSADVATQVAAMGEIYSNASTVSVLLPKEDAQALGLLAALAGYASRLLPHRKLFEAKGTVNDKVSSEISATIKSFFSTATTLVGVTEKSKYWSRAWTFQEWALARDIEISLDGRKQPILRNVKSKVIDAAILVTDYKLRLGQYSNFDVGFSRGMAPSVLDTVKQLFPSEERFLGEDEKDEAQVRFQANFPSYGTDQVLGVRLKPTQRTTEEAFRARLTAMLEAFNGGATRHATFEADKICCWASMCNIDYGYAKDDPLNTAVTKVTRTLRKRGLKLFNFHCSGSAPPDVNPRFFAYSFPHPQCNVTNGDVIPGVPILSGRMDTAAHLLYSITFSSADWNIPEPVEAFQIEVQEVKDYGFVTSLLDDKNQAMATFRMATSGAADNYTFTNVLDHVAGGLAQLPQQARLTHMVVVASLPVGPGSAVRFQSWVVIALPLLQKLYSNGWTYMFVGRESLNGTLVVGLRKPEVPKHEATVVLGYLALSDNQCGSFLIQTSSEGDISIMLVPPQRSDAVNSALMPRRALIAEVGLEPPLFRGTVSQDREFKLVNNNSAIKFLESPRESAQSTLEQLMSKLEGTRLAPP